MRVPIWQASIARNGACVEVAARLGRLVPPGALHVGYIACRLANQHI